MKAAGWLRCCLFTLFGNFFLFPLFVFQTFCSNKAVDNESFVFRNASGLLNYVYNKHLYVGNHFDAVIRYWDNLLTDVPTSSQHIITTVSVTTHTEYSVTTVATQTQYSIDTDTTQTQNSTVTPTQTHYSSTTTATTQTQNSITTATTQTQYSTTISTTQTRTSITTDTTQTQNVNLSEITANTQLPGVRAIRADIVEDRLYEFMMRDYEKDIRPTPHHRLATNVTFGFLLQMVVDVDEKNQVLTTRCWLNVNWMDYRLQWNASEFSDIQVMHIPHYKVWKPDVILTNNADPEYQEAIVSTDVYVNPRGNISWLASAIFRSSCQMRVRFYPFDDQSCNMTFASWSHNGEEINLKLLTEEGDLSSYVNNSEFNLISMEILPCVLISSMAMLGFYVPPDTGEKVTMCITTMLSMGVYLKTITEIIPPTSEAVPLIGVYYVVSLFMVCSATVVNVWTLNLHNRGFSNRAKNPPIWVQKWVLNYMAKFLFITIHPPDSPALLQHPDDDEDIEPANHKHHHNWKTLRNQSIGKLGRKLFKHETTSLRQLTRNSDNYHQSQNLMNSVSVSPSLEESPQVHLRAGRSRGAGSSDHATPNFSSNFQKNYTTGKLTLMAPAHPPTKEFYKNSGYGIQLL